uniref:Phospholipid-transporting ATPase n=1 Tax=Globisporangium ultimum (strain ATCC 200006 / CBS 805.95 / DAOM BR144) TaxID=431595 RepID=K3XBQ1_GLOUD
MSSPADTPRRSDQDTDTQRYYSMEEGAPAGRQSAAAGVPAAAPALPPVAAVNVSMTGLSTPVRTGNESPSASYIEMDPSVVDAVPPASSNSNSSRMSSYFHRNQTVEVLRRQQDDDGERSLRKSRPNSELFRTFTSTDPLSYRQRLLDDSENETVGGGAGASAGVGGPTHPAKFKDRNVNGVGTPTARGDTTASRGGSSWRLFYRNLPALPRSLRFRQNTRSTTRYIDRANAASLRSRLRARQEEEDARTNFADTMSPHHDSTRPMTDFELQMANLRQDSSTQADPNAPAGPSSFHAAPSGIPTLASKLSQRLFGRTSSMFSLDSNAAAVADRKNYRIVKINGGGNLLESEILSEVDEDFEGGDNAANEVIFPGNEVKTSQYTWWSFTPVFLYLTFQKTANLYFLLIGIFQMIPDLSPTDGVPLQFIPLAIVTIIDAVFAGFEDYKRHIADDLANTAKTHSFNRELREFEEVDWRDVKVGDFVKIKNHETLPADVLILSVVPAEGARSGGNTGVCYVETKNLDGETNLKLREAPQVTRSMFVNEEDAGEVMQGYVESELPNGDINRYSGTLYLDDTDSNADVGIALSLKNMLLRGSKLRNTSFVYGLVVNTGVDTKIMMSSGDEFPVKVSSIDEMTNKQVIIVVLLLMLMSLIGAISDNIWMHDQTIPSYIDNDLSKSILGTFVYYFTTLASMVPITLYVSITLVKALQAYFMERDLDMYDEENDIPMVARNMQLNEQLGQISHIFSDKTGTLTCNKMEFRKCSINGQSYGKGITAIGLAARLRDDFQGNRNVDDESENEDDEFVKCPAPNVNFKDRRIWQHLAQEGEEQSEKIKEFFTHLALCHGVLIERIDTVPEGMEELPIQYSASSPDEQALVCGAKYFGYEFIDREPGSVSLKRPNGKVDKYDVLEVFEFDSTRKRMTVIVQRRKTDEELMQMTENDEDEVLVLTKGADSVLFPRLAPDSVSKTNAKTRQKTLADLETFAQDGLRTLVICSKKMSMKDWESFHEGYRRALADLQEVEAKARGDKNAIDLLQDELESGFDLLGATAIEDRLQDGVPETMEQLAKAGINIWVLTGDMEETAINIGYACRLLNNDMQRHVINSATYRTKGSILRQLDKVFHSIYDVDNGDENNETNGATPTYPSMGTPMKKHVEHALVIDGGCLNLILEDPLYNLHLLRVSLLCKVVVACRVSPQQKAQLVELVKLNVHDSHTLSIGDGANDVPMIQSAHIGVGISGQEGMQAVNSSDYALGQFRFLSPLLLVHGRWNYDRVAALTVYTFYKNVVYCVSMFWYAMLATAYSGTMLYSAFIQQGYNLIFTALPIMIYSVFDRDLPKDVVLKFPVLYHSSTRKYSLFSYQMFWKWIFLGIIDSVGVYFASLALADNIMRNGESVEYTVLESVAWTILCLVVNARFCLMVNSWDVLEIASMIVTVLALYGFQYIVDLITWSSPDYDTYTFPWIFARGGFWLGQLFAIVAVLMKDFFFEGCRRRFVPEYADLVKETTSALPSNKENSGDTSSPVYEELMNFKPTPANYLNPELATMMDYKERRVLDRVPVRYVPAGRENKYRGFAFDQPAYIVNWILNNGSNQEQASRRKGINVQVRQQILTSEDPVIFENERYQPFCGFGSTYPGYLLPTDRSRWSDRSGKVSAQVIPLAGLQLNMDTPGCDEEGWVYATDFSLFPSTPLAPLSRRSSKDGGQNGAPPAASNKKPGKKRGYQGFVRRREWILSEEYKDLAEKELRRRENRLSNLSAVEVEDEKEEL